MEIDVFVSYSRKDREVADAVNDYLAARSMRSWIDRRDLRGGQVWRDSIKEAIDGCRVMVLIVSESSSKSSEVAREVRYALHRNKAIVPFKISAVSEDGDDGLTYLIFDRHYVNGSRPPSTEELERLAGDVAALIGADRHPPTVELVSPAAGAVWLAGETHRIEWLAAAPQGTRIDRIGVELTADSVRVRGIPGEGAFLAVGTSGVDWTIPGDLPPSTRYAVRVTVWDVWGHAVSATTAGQLAIAREPLAREPATHEAAVRRPATQEHGALEAVAQERAAQEVPLQPATHEPAASESPPPLDAPRVVDVPPIGTASAALERTSETPPIEIVVPTASTSWFFDRTYLVRFRVAADADGRVTLWLARDGKVVRQIAAYDAAQLAAAKAASDEASIKAPWTVPRGLDAGTYEVRAELAGPDGQLLGQAATQVALASPPPPPVGPALEESVAAAFGVTCSAALVLAAIPLVRQTLGVVRGIDWTTDSIAKAFAMIGEGAWAVVQANWLLVLVAVFVTAALSFIAAFLRASFEAPRRATFLQCAAVGVCAGLGFDLAFSEGPRRPFSSVPFSRFTADSLSNFGPSSLSSRLGDPLLYSQPIGSTASSFSGSLADQLLNRPPLISQPIGSTSTLLGGLGGSLAGDAPLGEPSQDSALSRRLRELYTTSEPLTTTSPSAVSSAYDKFLFGIGSSQSAAGGVTSVAPLEPSTAPDADLNSERIRELLERAIPLPQEDTTWHTKPIQAQWVSLAWGLLVGCILGVVLALQE